MAVNMDEEYKKYQQLKVDLRKVVDSRLKYANENLSTHRQLEAQWWADELKELLEK